MILAFDTSLPFLSVALTGDTGLIGSVILEGRMSRNEKLLPVVDWLVTESGKARSEIKLIAVTRGPGSFTGVRIGLATAQGLALALGIPVCAMSTHEAVVCGDPDLAQRRVLICSDAGRGESYTSAFDQGVEVIAPCLFSAERLEAAKPEFEQFVGLDLDIERRNAAHAAALHAAALFGSGRISQYAVTTPIYVRLAEAEARMLKGSDG